VLHNPATSVVLAARQSRGELLVDVELLRADGPLPVSECRAPAEHGQRVRRRAGSFR
jgi:hypothetical protein